MKNQHYYITLTLVFMCTLSNKPHCVCVSGRKLKVFVENRGHPAPHHHC